jgi:hypothetical protein
MNTYKIVKQKETKTAIVTLGSDDVVRVLFKHKAELTPEELVVNYQVYNEIIDGNIYAFILSAENSSVDYTAEGRAYAKMHEDDWPKLCVALCVKSLAHKMLANFYLKFNKPNYTHKVFDNISAAENWCLDEVESSKRNGFSSMPIFI